MKKEVSILMAGTILASSVLSTAPTAYADTSGVNFRRVSGKDRYETCAKISKEKFEKAEMAIIASGEDYPDALSSGVLSLKHRAPLLLVENDQVPASIKAEIKRLGVKNIIIVGGENSVSKKVAEELAKNAKVERIAGEDRFETSLDVAKKVGYKDSILVNGNDFPDALIANAIASKLNKNLILTNGKTLNREQMHLINQSEENLILGGSASMMLKGIKGVQIGGKDRYETSIEVAKKYFPTTRNIVLANGENFSDALSAVSLLEGSKQPILLVDDKESAENLKKYLSESNSRATVRVVGGENTIPQSILDTIKDKPSSNGGGSSKPSRPRPKPEVKEELADGKYKGSGKGLRSGYVKYGEDKNIEVEVEIKDGNIENIEITKFGDDTLESSKHYDALGYSQKFLDKYMDKIKKKNTTFDLMDKLKACLALSDEDKAKTDVSSGATYTCMGLIEAIDNALAVSKEAKKNDGEISNSKDMVFATRYEGYREKKLEVGDTINLADFSIKMRTWDGKEEVVQASDFKKAGIKASMVTNFFDAKKKKYLPIKGDKVVLTEEMLVQYQGSEYVFIEFEDEATGHYLVYRAYAQDFADGVFKGSGNGLRSGYKKQIKDRNIEVEVTMKNRKIENIEITKYGDDKLPEDRYNAEAMSEEFMKKFNGEIKENNGSGDLIGRLKKLLVMSSEEKEGLDTVSGATYANIGILEAIDNAVAQSKSKSASGEVSNSKDLAIAGNPESKTLRVGDKLSLDGFSVERRFWDNSKDENKVIPSNEFGIERIYGYVVKNFFDEENMEREYMRGGSIEITEDMLTNVHGRQYVFVRFYDRNTGKECFYRINAEDFADGKFKAVGNGYDNEQVEVALTMKDKKIEDIEVVSFPNPEEAQEFIKDNLEEFKAGNFSTLRNNLKKEIAEGGDEQKLQDKIGLLDAIEGAVKNSKTTQINGEEPNAKDLIVKSAPEEALKIGQTVNLDKIVVERRFWDNSKDENKEIPFSDFASNDIRAYRLKNYYEGMKYDYVRENNFELTEDMVTELNGKQFLFIQFYDKVTGQHIDYRLPVEGEIEAEKNEDLEDGTYIGVGNGFRSDKYPERTIEVEVTIEDQKIKDLKVVKFGDDDYYRPLSDKFMDKFFPQIKQKGNTLGLLERIKAAIASGEKDADVEVQTGATFSNRGVIEAIEGALENSRNAKEGEIATIKEMTFAKKPASAVVKYTDKLDLSQFSIKFIHDDNTEEVVPFAEFESKGITTSLENGIEVTKSNEDISFDGDGNFTVVFTDTNSGKTVDYTFQAQKKKIYLPVGSIEIKFEGSDVLSIVEPEDTDEFSYDTVTNIEDAVVESITVKDDEGNVIEGTTFEEEYGKYRVNMPEIKSTDDEVVEKYRTNFYKIKVIFEEGEEIVDPGTDPEPEGPSIIMYEDGTYEGSARGFRGDNVFDITTESGVVTKIELKEFKDDSGFFKGILEKNIKRITDKIAEINNNSEGNPNQEVIDYLASLSAELDSKKDENGSNYTDIDSGATYSTLSMVNATKDAMEKDIPHMDMTRSLKEVKKTSLIEKLVNLIKNI